MIQLQNLAVTCVAAFVYRKKPAIFIDLDFFREAFHADRFSDIRDRYRIPATVEPYGRKSIYAAWKTEAGIEGTVRQTNKGSFFHLQKLMDGLLTAGNTVFLNVGSA